MGFRPSVGAVWRFALASIVAGFACPGNAAQNCEGAENIRLSRPVVLDPALQAALSALPPLKVEAVDSAPMARYDTQHQAYDGIAIDILCFIAREVGLQFEISRPDDGKTVSERIRAVQSGKADLFIPISHTPERATQGIFTQPFYASYYAVIGRRASNVEVRNVNDLAHYKVGYVEGFSFEPILKAHVPAQQLHAFSQWTTDGLFQSLRDGSIDVALFSKHVFTEKRYQDRLLDLDIVHVLYDFPRQYRFYFSPSPVHQRLAEVFDAYLDAIDLSASVMRHQDGERDFLRRYLNERSQLALLFMASSVAALLGLAALLALLRHRRLLRRLKERNCYIEHQHHALCQANRKLETLSQTDALTGLPNRRYFDEKADKAYQLYRRGNSALSLLVIDIDHFKQINDSYGHATGDAYLRTIAQTLLTAIRPERQTLARYGGEEFTCLLPETGTDVACAIAEQLRLAIANLDLPTPDTSHPSVTVSIGIATAAGSDPGIGDLYRQADRVLYLAKQNGRNQIRSIVIEHGPTRPDPAGEEARLVVE